MKAILNTLAVVSFLSLAVACSDDEEPAAEESSGGENAFETAEQSANEAHEDFKEEIRPAAEFVDEKTKKAVDEGKKAVDKVGEAVSGEDDDEEPKPGQP